MLNSTVRKILQVLVCSSVCNVYECAYLTSLAIKSNMIGKAIGEVVVDITALSYEYVLLSSSSLSHTMICINISHLLLNDSLVK